MKTIKIFLASSEELRQERLEMADVIENLNTRLKPLNIQIQLVKWEYLDSSMGPVHKQEEYLQELRDCEMCIVIYWTKFGDYTTMELDTAYQRLCNEQNPRKLYVYFKDGGTITPELESFRDSFPENYGHFYSHFSNVDTLKSDFLLQFIDYQKNYLQNSSFVEIRGDGQVRVGGEVYVELKNLNFVGNNEEYNRLIRDIKKTEKLLSITDSDDSDYREYAIELQGLLEKKKEMEESLWDTALRITRLSSTKYSERLMRAKNLFLEGNNNGAMAILNEDEIDNDIQHNLRLIQLGKEGQKGLSSNIDEYLLKINILRNNVSTDWYLEVDRLYKKCIDAGRDNISAEKIAEILLEYGNFLEEQNSFSESEELYKESLKIYRRLAKENPQAYEPGLASTIGNLANLYQNTNRLEESEELYNESLEIYRRLAKGNPQAYEPDLARTIGGLSYLKNEIGQFAEAEQLAIVALNLDSSQHFIYSNLAAARLFQGKYEEAWSIYKKYKDELKDDFIDDFEQYSQLDIIPNECRSEVERIKRMLTSND